MSDTRRLKREAARQQAQQRLRKTLASQRGRTQEPGGLFGSTFLRGRRPLYFLVALALVVLIGFPVVAPNPGGTPVDTATAQAPLPTPLPTPTKTFAEPQQQDIALDKKYLVTITTPKGSIRAELFPFDDPSVVNNFVFLTRQEFYNQLPVYRVVPGLRVELGALNADGTGGPGYTLAPPPNLRPLDIGVLAMVPGEDNTIASQFLIALAAQSDLPEAGHTVFGRVTDGLDVVRQLKEGDQILSVRVAESELP